MKHAYPMINLPGGGKSNGYGEDGSEQVLQIAAVLKDAWKHYNYPIRLLPFSPGSVETFERSFNALVRTALPYNQLQKRMKNFFEQNPIHKMDQSSIGLEIYQLLVGVGLKEDLETIVAEVIAAEIRKYVRESYSEVWHVSVLDPFRVWLTQSLIPALELLLGRSEGQEMENRLLELGGDAIVDLRIQELFDIVVDYPNSTAALQDLRTSLKKSGQRATAVSVFQQSCSRRLLQGGANTVDILSGYIATIKSFAILEPRGVLLEKVSRPIRRYLREREDTIAAIVSGILGDESSQLGYLSEELVKGKQEGDDMDDLSDPNWQPDPLDAPPDFMKGKTSDIVGCLISLYENKDIFVKEFVSIFADRLLQEKEAVDDIMMKLEFLKLRFGEQELQKLDVMVKDINESKRIDKALHTTKVQGRSITKKVHAKVLSRLYWPTFTDSSLILPDVIENQLQMYSEGYSKIKQGRKLKWLRNIGTVKIELQLEDRKLEFDVTPEQSAVIAFFQEGSRTVQQICEAFEMDESKSRQLIMFWVNKRVLARDQNEAQRYYVREREIEDDGQDEGAVDDVGTGTLSREEERAREESELYWPFIRGMLTNHGTMPVDRIHTFLKMLVPADKGYTKTIEELERYLNFLVNEEKLEEAPGGGYKLAK